MHDCWDCCELACWLEIIFTQSRHARSSIAELQVCFVSRCNVFFNRTCNGSFRASHLFNFDTHSAAVCRDARLRSFTFCQYHFRIDTKQANDQRWLPRKWSSCFTTWFLLTPGSASRSAPLYLLYKPAAVKLPLRLTRHLLDVPCPLPCVVSRWCVDTEMCGTWTWSCVLLSWVASCKDQVRGRSGLRIAFH